MFITKTTSVYDTGVYANCESVQEAVIESIAESYEDLANFNDALAHFDIKETELACTESSSLVPFQEEALEKAKAFLVNLIKKIKARLRQFMAFVNKKMTDIIFKINKNIEKTAADAKVTDADVADALKDIEGTLVPSKDLETVIDIISTQVNASIANAETNYDPEKENNGYSNDDIKEDFKKVITFEKGVKGGKVALGDIAKGQAAFKSNFKDKDSNINKKLDELTKAAGEDVKEAAKRANWIALKGRVVVQYGTSLVRQAVSNYASVLNKAIKKAKANKKDK